MKKYLYTLLLLLPSLALAEEAPTIDTGDTAWMMMSAALVLLMTPAGLALFYAGMTRSKNVLNTYAMVLGAFAVAFVAWIVAGYSMALTNMPRSCSSRFASRIFISFGTSSAKIAAAGGVCKP